MVSSKILTIILFLIYTLGPGYLITSFLWKKNSWFERFVISLGIGLATIPIIGCFLNITRIVIDWRIFFLISLVSIIYAIYREKKSLHIPKFSTKITLFQLCAMGALLILILNMYFFSQGAFSYDWLGDGDSWHHALSAKYVAAEKTLHVSEGNEASIRYIDPYPPGYPILMGLLYQTSGHMMWTLKLFNIFLASIGILFFYFLAKEFTNDPKKSLFATFVLASLPSFLTRFIWAHTFIISISIILLYAVLKTTKDSRWKYAAAILFGSTLLIQPSQNVKLFAIMLIFLGTMLPWGKKHIKKNMITALTIFVIAGLVMMLWYAPMAVKYEGEFLAKITKTDKKVDPEKKLEKKAKKSKGKTYIGPLGSATRLYKFDDFFRLPEHNQINNPVGWGEVIFVLMVLGLISLPLNGRALFRKKKWKLCVFFWFAFAFAGLFGGTVLPVALFSFRFWMLVAIPLSLIATEGLWLFMGVTTSVVKLTKKQLLVKVVKVFFFVLVVYLVFITTTENKIALNKGQWFPEPAHVQYNQLGMYLWLRTIPENTKVFYGCHRDKFGDHTIISYDMWSCPWCPEIKKFRDNAIDESGYVVTPKQMETFLKDNKFEFMLMDGNCVDSLKTRWRKGFDKIDDDAAMQSALNYINSMMGSGLFDIISSEQGVILKVV